ncbi:sigma-70 family RNA polymerase sigma factor [Solwaraspora sp. WMMD406]|uniref:sigma-70 family RNA polymerase sigma factor n=1 Tax=Solwaraspora sp. WMMD406 TaxID=3016095 RepID=UPI002416CFC4|nr:sigma-70 family RNA polymerase sigma factor [Solwaraspora sp. WMMD406]MDG4766104.1 sigma-70 family RNA polymerase sigma factor [Solwaraspora sp. WMMD406]
MPHAGPDERGPRDADITRWALAARDGDRDSATAFIAGTQHHVQRFLTHVVGAAEAEDLTQETYLRAMRALPRFAARSTARTWLLAIARRVAVDHIRAAVVRPRVADLDDWQAVAETVTATSAPRFDGAVVLRQLLRDLPADRREAFVATQVLGLSYAEAAEVCDCPIGTIRSRVARAREDLVAAMAADGDRSTGRHLRAIG